MRTRQTPEEVAIWLCNNVPAMRPQFGPEDEAVIAQAIRVYGDLRAAQERERVKAEVRAIQADYPADVFPSREGQAARHVAERVLRVVDALAAIRAAT